MKINYTVKMSGPPFISLTLAMRKERVETARTRERQRSPRGMADGERSSLTPENRSNWKAIYVAITLHQPTSYKYILQDALTKGWPRQIVGTYIIIIM